MSALLNAPLCLPASPSATALVSLWEILNNYNVWQLVVALEQIQEIECQYKSAVTSQPQIADIPLSEAECKRLANFTAYWRMQFAHVGLMAAIGRLDTPIRVALQTNRMTHGNMATQMEVLRESVRTDLNYRRFAFVPPDRAELLDHVGEHWKVVWDKLPDSITDTMDALECYALGKGTASVFHSMRIAEYCLRGLAKRLRVKLTHKGKTQPIEFADWDKIITACNNTIALSRSKSPGPQRQRLLTFYSEAAQHCLFMKDIWRNNIAHTRQSYNDGEAKGVMDRVHDFAEFVATRIVP